MIDTVYFLFPAVVYILEKTLFYSLQGCTFWEIHFFIPYRGVHFGKYTPSPSGGRNMKRTKKGGRKFEKKER
jgi:hypothetical protein